MSDKPSRWKYTIQELKQAIENSVSYHEALGKLGINAQGGGAYTTIKKRVKELNIDISHFVGRGWNIKNKAGIGNKEKPLSEILIENSDYNRTSLKKRLIKEGYLENKCSICGNEAEWNNKPLVMRLDHINGINNDNRLENLRLNCPNCDSQLPTHAGKNKKSITKTCINCNRNLGKGNKSGYCQYCFPKFNKSKKSK